MEYLSVSSSFEEIIIIDSCIHALPYSPFETILMAV